MVFEIGAGGVDGFGFGWAVAGAEAFGSLTRTTAAALAVVLLLPAACAVLAVPLLLPLALLALSAATGDDVALVTPTPTLTRAAGRRAGAVQELLQLQSKPTQVHWHWHDSPSCAPYAWLELPWPAAAVDDAAEEQPEACDRQLAGCACCWWWRPSRSPASIRFHCACGLLMCMRGIGAQYLHTGAGAHK